MYLLFAYVKVSITHEKTFENRRFFATYVDKYVDLAYFVNVEKWTTKIRVSVLLHLQYLQPP